LIWCSL